MDARTRALLERIELLPVNRVHRAAARASCEHGEALADRALGVTERLRSLFAALKRTRSVREEHG
jgi:hypothetical protein